MGAGSSTKSSTPKRRLREDEKPLEGINYIVKTSEGPGGENVIIRMGRESLLVIDPKTKETIRSYAYYKIICWGHTPSTFQFRFFDASNQQRSTTFITEQGIIIESSLLSTIIRLMDEMKTKATSNSEFDTFFDCLDQTDQDLKVNAIRQFSASRSFTVKQAIQLVNEFEFVFDKIEVACILYSHLLSLDSFHHILNLFDYQEDRDNICHRLGISYSSNRFRVGIVNSSTRLLPSEVTCDAPLPPRVNPPTPKRLSFSQTEENGKMKEEIVEQEEMKDLPKE